MLEPLPLNQLLAETPDVEWIIDQILPVGGAMGLVAAAGVGKTWLSLDLAISVATGKLNVAG